MENISLKNKLKRVPFIRLFYRFAIERLTDLKAIRVLLLGKTTKHKHNTIRVGFICQYTPAWSKSEAIYRAMQKDPRFDPYLICVPSGIRNHELLQPDSLENDTYDYFIQHGYPEAYNALICKNTWLDLKALDLSYIFYPRPYNTFMPECYTSRSVGKYCKICMLMYCIEPTKEITKTILNRDFMSNVSYYFAEHSFVRDVNIKKNRILHWLKLQKTVCLGIPVLEQLYEKRTEFSPSWKFSRNRFRVMWTPRWTTELSEGGSNFFTYYKELLDFAEAHPDIDFLIRPHPLTFPHFIETGEITVQEVEEYKARCQSLPNVSMDEEQQYDATLWGTSVLISDISGIMPEYLATGNPLIYCASNMHLELSAFGQRMAESCYIVHNRKELFHCLLMLQSGQDPLFQTRQDFISQVYGNSNLGTYSRILELLAKEH